MTKLKKDRTSFYLESFSSKLFGFFSSPLLLLPASRQGEIKFLEYSPGLSDHRRRDHQHS